MDDLPEELRRPIFSTPPPAPPVWESDALDDDAMDVHEMHEEAAAAASFNAAEAVDASKSEVTADDGVALPEDVAVAVL